MNKEYIKGFFDGEGSVNIVNPRIVITNTNFDLLNQISIFLKKQNIDHFLIYFDSKNKKHRNYWRIIINKITEIEKYYKKIGINDCAKKEKVEFLLSKSSKIKNIKNKEKIKKLYWKGLSVRKIARKLEISPSTVFRYIEKYKFKKDPSLYIIDKVLGIK